MFLLHEGHMFFVCGSGLFSVSPAIINSARSVCRVSEPLTSLRRHGWLAGKTTGVRPSLGGRAEVAGEKISPLSRFGRLLSPADGALTVCRSLYWERRPASCS